MASFKFGYGFDRFPGRGPARYSPEASQFLARVPSVIDTTHKALYANLIDELVAGGVWSRGDVLGVAAPDGTALRQNLIKAAHTAVLVNNPVITPFRGVAGNGSNSYLRTQFNPATQGVNFTQDSASIGVWNRTVRAGAGNALMGAANGSTQNLTIFPLWPPSITFARVNNNEDAGIAGTGSSGWLVGNRSGPTAREAYRNGVSLGSYPVSASSAPINQVVFVGGVNLNGSPILLSTDQVAAWWIGGSLNAAEQATLYSALNTYMVAIGAA